MKIILDVKSALPYGLQTNHCHWRTENGEISFFNCVACVWEFLWLPNQPFDVALQNMRKVVCHLRSRSRYLAERVGDTMIAASKIARFRLIVIQATWSWSPVQ